MIFTINIAGINIRISSVYPGVYTTCKDYLVEEYGKPDIEISINEETLINELKLARRQDKTATMQSVERLLIPRIIAEKVLDYDVFLMHGAVIANNNKSYMFAAKSGTGKTTHIQKWLEQSGSFFVVNGDKPLIKIDEDGIYACGTPWCGKEDMGTNVIVPLSSIVFMERSLDNHIEEVPFKSIIPLLLTQTYQPTNAFAMRKTLDLLLKLKDVVSFYKFSFNNYKEDAFEVAFEALTSEDRNC